MIPLSAFFAAAGCALGFFLAALLFASGVPGRQAHHWLGALVFSVALLSLQDLLDDARVPLQHVSLGHLFDWLIFVVGPLTYIYVCRMTGHDRPRAAALFAHGIPALIIVLLLAPFWFAPVAEKRTSLESDYARAAIAIDWVLVIAVLHVLGYWIASLVIVRRHRESLAREFSALERIGLRWLSVLLAINFCIWLAWAASVFAPYPAPRNLAAAVVPFGLYLLGLAGWRHREAAVRTALAPRQRELPPALPAVPSPPAARYERSGLDAEKMATLRARLDEVMELEKPWLENDLTLGGLATRAGMTTHHLSQLLNDAYGKTFFDLINELRAREVRRCLDDPAYGGRNVLEIGLAAGFNSQGALNASFRKFFGSTPGRYRRLGNPTG